LSKHLHLYFIAFFMPLLLSLILTPVLRKIAVKWKFFDVPSDLKTHKIPVPHVGGLAILLSFSATLVFFRFYTSFPTGTLHNLRFLLFGGFVMFLLGFVDDIHKPEGLSVRAKFAIQFLTAFFVVFYGIKINFIFPEYISQIISVLWIVGISNAINIIDIMDGLSASQVMIASFGFFIIALPSESIYVNFASASLLGAAAGFIPYNFSGKIKTFMGDSGSLFCGFVLAFIAMGTDYSRTNPLGVYAPLLILGLPIYDTVFVSILRMTKGQSPFKGSNDHFALRLKVFGFKPPQIIIISALFALLLSLSAYMITRLSLFWGSLIYIGAFGAFLITSFLLMKVDVDG